MSCRERRTRNGVLGCNRGGHLIHKAGTKTPGMLLLTREVLGRMTGIHGTCLAEAEAHGMRKRVARW